MIHDVFKRGYVLVENVTGLEVLSVKEINILFLWKQSLRQHTLVFARVGHVFSASVKAHIPTSSLVSHEVAHTRFSTSSEGPGKH